MIVGKMIDNMTRVLCISADLVNSGDNYSNLVHHTEIGTYTGSDKTNSAKLVG